MAEKHPSGWPMLTVEKGHGTQPESYAAQKDQLEVSTTPLNMVLMIIERKLIVPTGEMIGIGGAA